jgi:hypothetical protein
MRYAIEAKMVCVQRYFVEAPTPEKAMEKISQGKCSSAEEPEFERYLDFKEWCVEEDE